MITVSINCIILILYIVFINAFEIIFISTFGLKYNNTSLLFNMYTVDQCNFITPTIYNSFHWPDTDITNTKRTITKNNDQTINEPSKPCPMGTMSLLHH